MRIYISGPMTGIPDYNFPAFEAAVVDLRARGHEVVSPHEIEPLPCLGSGDAELIWRQYMREDIILLARCDKIMRLPGYENSRGAKLELVIAEALGMEIEDYATAEH